jgi:hypothetical protein
MTVMTRQRALTVLTDDLFIGEFVHFKSPCFRALNIRDGVKGYARKLHPKGYLFIADERQKKQMYGYGFILERSELLARRCLLLEDGAVRIIEKGLWI